MKRIFVSAWLVAAVSFGGCQKQQSDEERRAEVERQVQERLSAERQQQQLDQREADLKAREEALNQKQSQPRATVAAERGGTREESEEREPAGSYSLFYTKLEPYGDWIDTDDYGYVFRPREGTDSRWRPYTSGRWVYTDAGWTWISQEPFGWACYHYGRWTRLRGIGWVWVPGNDWAPAWVSWRKGSEYVGWAPLPPEARFDRRTGIRNWSDNYYDIGPDQYVFVPTQQFGAQRVEQVIVPQQRNTTIVTQTTNVTNITYNNTIVVNKGPDYEELRGQSRQPIERLRLERQITLQGDNPRSIVRGDVVEMPAPLLAERPAERPPSVRQRVAQAAVDLGWAAIANQQEAEQVRAKIRAEASAPPNAPPKKFVKSATATATNMGPSPTATASIAATASATPGAASNAKATATAMPAAPETETSATPFRGRPSATPLSQTAPAAPAIATATASASVIPSAAASPVTQPLTPLPTTTPSAAPESSSPPTTAALPVVRSKAERKAEKQQMKAARQQEQSLAEQQPSAAAPAISPAASLSATPAAETSAVKQGKDNKPRRQRVAQPSPTAPAEAPGG